jgi:RimJ/RimL family protein N-acetyltransferase
MAPRQTSSPEIQDRLPHPIETDRLLIRHFTLDDAEFVVRVLNEPSFIENVGDRGVRTTEDGVKYLADGPIASYEANGYGMNVVVLKETGERIGMCGLVRRPQFADPDVGYSFLPEFWRRGYAEESVIAVIAHARISLGIERVIAIVSPHNIPSTRLLEKRGFVFEKRTLFQPSGREILVYTLDLTAKAMGEEQLMLPECA